MSDEAASPSSEPSSPKLLPAPIRALLVLVVLGAIVGGVYVAFSGSGGGGGAIGFESPVTSSIGTETETRVVPGRSNATLDRADVWTIPLRAGEAVTVHACASSRSGRSTNPTPRLVVHGPAGADDRRVESAPGTLPPWRSAIVYTPTSTGEHSIWVYKGRTESPYSYHLEVLHGAHPEPSGDLCALPYH